MAIERDSKLVITWHAGKREVPDAQWFCQKLAAATVGPFHLTTDGWTPYCVAVPDYLRGRVDYAQLIKVYASTRGGGTYSPAEIIGIRSRVMLGKPDRSKVCTSHAERSNLSIRMSLRRMTRLTNGHSKKWQNHHAALSLYFTY